MSDSARVRLKIISRLKVVWQPNKLPAHCALTSARFSPLYLSDRFHMHRNAALARYKTVYCILCNRHDGLKFKIAKPCKLIPLLRQTHMLAIHEKTSS